eukprot:g2100.t1
MAFLGSASSMLENDLDRCGLAGCGLGNGDFARDACDYCDAQKVQVYVDESDGRRYCDSCWSSWYSDAVDQNKTSASSNTVVPERTRTDLELDLRMWLGCEASERSCVEIRDDGEAGRALFATRDMSKGEVLLSVPKRLIVLTSAIKNSALGHKIERVLSQHRLHCISEQLYLRIWLVHAWVQGAAGVHWTYLKSLPTTEELSGSPVAWAAEDTARRAALAGTSLLRRASDIRRKLQCDCETLQRESVFESNGEGKPFDFDHATATRADMDAKAGTEAVDGLHVDVGAHEELDRLSREYMCAADVESEIEMLEMLGRLMGAEEAALEAALEDTNGGVSMEAQVQMRRWVLSEELTSAQFFGELSRWGIQQLRSPIDSAADDGTSTGATEEAQIEPRACWACWEGYNSEVVEPLLAERKWSGEDIFFFFGGGD